MSFVSVINVRIDHRLRTNLAFGADVIAPDKTLGFVDSADWYNVANDFIGHGCSYHLPDSYLHQPASQFNGETIIPVNSHLKANLKKFAISYLRKHHELSKYRQLVDKAFKVEPKAIPSANY